jgi:RNA polymerase sigma-70 factor, ECF subfamily
MELVAAGQRGDLLAFSELCEHNRKAIFRVAMRITRSREDAEDAVQDSLLRAFLQLRSFHGRSRLSTWLTRITINSSLMTLRKRRLSREVPIPRKVDEWENPLLEMIDSAPDPEEYLARREEEAMLHEGIRNLPQRLRSVVEIRELRELSLEVSAEVLGITVSAAKARMLRGKIALKKYLTVKRTGVKTERFRNIRSHGQGQHPRSRYLESELTPW